MRELVSVLKCVNRGIGLVYDDFRMRGISPAAIPWAGAVFP